MPQDHATQLKKLQAAYAQLATIANALLKQHNDDTATITGLRNDKAGLAAQVLGLTNQLGADEQQLTDYDAAADATVSAVQQLQDAVNGGTFPAANAATGADQTVPAGAVTNLPAANGNA